MNISPVSFVRPNILKFKGEDKVSKPIDDNSIKSRQNNSPEYSIDNSSYIQGLTNQAIQSLDNVNYSQYKDILKPFNESDEDEDNCNFDNLGFGINLPKAGMAAAVASLVSIKAMANVMGLPPEEIAGSIPGLVNYMADNYLHFLEKSTDNVIKEVSADFGVQTEDLDKEQDEQFAFLGANSDMLNVIHQSVQSTIEALRTNKEMLQDALDTLSLAYNYKLCRVIQNGFNSDARQVLLELTNNLILGVNPVIEDNNDGTLTYIYNTLGQEVVVKRDASNLDYISAYSSNTGTNKKDFNVQFNIDGSIKCLEQNNEIDGIKVVISQDKKTNTVKVQQYFGGLMTDRSYVYIDGKLKQTSINLLPVKK